MKAYFIQPESRQVSQQQINTRDTHSTRMSSEFSSFLNDAQGIGTCIDEMQEIREQSVIGGWHVSEADIFHASDFGRAGNTHNGTILKPKITPLQLLSYINAMIYMKACDAFTFINPFNSHSIRSYYYTRCHPGLP